MPITTTLICPHCHSDALNKYGFAPITGQSGLEF